MIKDISGKPTLEMEGVTNCIDPTLLGIQIECQEYKNGFVPYIFVYNVDKVGHDPIPVLRCVLAVLRYPSFTQLTNCYIHNLFNDD